MRNLTSSDLAHLRKSSAERVRQLTRFANDLRNIDRLCCYCAVAVWKRFGGDLYGYWCNENTTAVVGMSCAGHDFAVVDDRYLVDGWAVHIEGILLAPVMDMQNPEDQETIDGFYGDRERWHHTRTASEWRGGAK